MYLSQTFINYPFINHFKKQSNNLKLSSSYSTSIPSQNSSLTNSRIRLFQIPSKSLKSLKRKNPFINQFQQNKYHQIIYQQRQSFIPKINTPKGYFPNHRNNMVNQNQSKITYEQKISKKVPKFIIERQIAKKHEKVNKSQILSKIVLQDQASLLKLQKVNNLFTMQKNQQIKNDGSIFNNDQVIQNQMEISFKKDGPIFYRSPSQPFIFLKDFQIIKFLRKTKLGEEFLAIHRQSCFFITLRRTKKEDLRKKNRDLLLIQELKYSFKNDTDNGDYNQLIRKNFGFFNDQRFFYTVLEYTHEKTLDQLITNNKKCQIEDKKILQIVCEINEYLRKIHKGGNFHGELKSKNVLFSNDSIKIIGMQGFRNSVKNLIKQFDMWCLGIIIYELIQQKTFDRKDELCLQLIRDPEKVLNNKKWDSIDKRSKQIKQLVKQLLNPIEQQRITSEQLSKLQIMKSLLEEQIEIQNNQSQSVNSQE